MKKTLLLALILAAALQLSAWGQGFGEQLTGAVRNPQVMQGLMNIINAQADIRTAAAGNKLDFSSTATRGGGGSPFHPKIGFYGVGDGVEFRSEYKDLDAQTMADWAYDLHNFVTASGGGWENFKRYQAEQPPANPLTQSLGGAQQPDAWDRSMVPYAKLQEFAEHYWDTHNDKFKHLASLWRGWWINDSILDGVNVYMEYQQRYGGQGNADFIGYKDGTLDRLMRKK